MQNDKYEELIADALSKSRNELKDALSHFTSDKLAYSLLTHQRVYFEIVYFDDGTFSFVPIADHTIIRFFGFIFQYVPNRLRQDNSSEDRQLPFFIRLNNCNVFYIDAPKHLKSTLKKIMKGLTYISDKNTMPDLMEDGMYSFDYSAYRRSVVRYVAKCTKAIGWSGRMLLKDEELEYYNLLRFMRFEQFKHELRECIIEGLNRGLKKVNKDWEPPQLVQTVFPQQNDIQTSMQQLHEGTVKFEDLIRPYLFNA